MELQDFTAENMHPHIGTTFHATIDEQDVPLVLEKVNIVLEKHIEPRMKRDAFNLLFSGPKDIYIKQGAYPMTHEGLGGPWDIFIVPISRYDDGRFHFEAIFT
ncbi:MAG TPA: hypothetical protein VGQ76_24685 [Thermoanaerobaculia bacterium]|nr:hypothetical protein [Thermoanaerobaculia bacterium]